MAIKFNVPAICKLSFFRILMFQQTSASTCKAHDFYYSIKINARVKRRHKYSFVLMLMSLSNLGEARTEKEQTRRRFWK